MRHDGRRLPTTLLLLAVALAACGDSGEEIDEQPAGTVEAGAVDDTVAMAGDAGLGDGALLDPNDVSRDVLLGVGGLSAAAVDALLAARPFDDMLQVDSVLAAQGLGEAEREEVYRQLWRPIDLNEASEEEILLIPGVGSRMAHEFDEYRPYEGIERFRREIGKYVDEEEVARLERYVEIR